MLINPFVNKPLVHYSASTPDSVEQKRQKNHKFNLIFVIYFVSYHSEFTPWKTSRSLLLPFEIISNYSRRNKFKRHL